MKLFTPGTARVALETVRGSAESMTRAYRSMEVLRPGKISSDQPVEREYFCLARALRGTLDRLQDAGVLVKDPKDGLLDFPARRAGRIVMLCWKVGEPGLHFWHETEAGFAGRQPVDEDGPWESQGVLADGPS